MIDAEIARGGMGVVYLARDEALGRRIALKVITPSLAADATFRTRFRNESRLSANVEHPNVVPVYRAGQDRGLLYIAMRFIEGTDLATTLRDHGALLPRDAAAVIQQVAAALDAAHVRGLVHRDVKPANVLLDVGGKRAFLTDFGLTVEAEGRQGLTRTGIWVGTPAYAAPEQLRGGGVDARTDVYSLGGVLYHCLTGQVPYPVARDLDAISAHLIDPPPRPSAVLPSLPRSLDRVIARAMSKDPAARFPSAGDLARAAVAAVDGEPPPRHEQSVATGAAAPQPVRGGGATDRRRRRWALAGVAVALVSSSAVVLVLARDGDGRSEAPTAKSSESVRVEQSISVRLPPDRLAVLAGQVWAIALEGGRLARVSPATRHVDEFAPAVDLGGSTYSGLAAGEGAIWVAHATESGGIDRVDPRTGQGTAHVPLGHASAVTVGAGAVWATTGGGSAGRANLVRIDPRSPRVVGRPVSAGRDPVAVAYGDGSLWVVNRAAGTVTRIEPGGRRVRKTIPVGSRPVAVAVGARAVWILNSADDSLTRIDPASDEPVGAAISLGKQLEDIVLAGGELWVAAADSTVTRLDAVSGAMHGVSVPSGRPPLALAADGSGVWVASGGDHTIQRLQPAEG